MTTESVLFDLPTSDKTRKAKPKPRYVVERGGIPCKLLPTPKMFGNKLVPKKGVLVPCAHDPHYFAGEKSAQAAIGRAVRLRNTLNSAVFGLPDNMKVFAASGNFEIRMLAPGLA